MLVAKFASGVSLAIAAVSALAQVPSMNDLTSRARPGDLPWVGEPPTHSDETGNILEGNPLLTIVNNLPDPGASEEALPVDYLRAARASLLLGHRSQAQRSLKIAETGALNTTVLQGRDHLQASGPLIRYIRDALEALRHGDSPETVRIIDRALAL